MVSLPNPSHPQRWLVMMVKEPRPGSVKTRLSEDIGTVPAARWYRHNCLRVLRRVDNDPRWQTVLAISPDIFAATSAVWPNHVFRLPQGPSHLGRKMRRVFKTLPPGPVLIIGSDIPSITAQEIWKAFRLCSNHGAVIGPSPDGGYWLVGMGRYQRFLPNLFQKVRWSSPHSLADTVKSLGSVPICFTTKLADVDTGNDM